MGKKDKGIPQFLIRALKAEADKFFAKRKSAVLVEVSLSNAGITFHGPGCDGAPRGNQAKRDALHLEERLQRINGNLVAVTLGSIEKWDIITMFVAREGYKLSHRRRWRKETLPPELRKDDKMCMLTVTSTKIQSK
jgi:hypothetical protein